MAISSYPLIYITQGGAVSNNSWYLENDNQYTYTSGERVTDYMTKYNVTWKTNFASSIQYAITNATSVTLFKLPNGNYCKATYSSNQTLNITLYAADDSVIGTMMNVQSSYWRDNFRDEFYITFVRNSSDMWEAVCTALGYWGTTAFYTNWNPLSFNASSNTKYRTFWGNTPFIDDLDPYTLSPESETGGGFGEFDYTSEDTDFSRLPTISACSVGFCTLFKMTGTEVKNLADYLWGLGSLASFLPIFSDPMECILSLGIVPVSPATGSTEMIKVGNLTTTVQGAKITKQFDTFDMGEIEITGAKYSKSFMDYSPYTKAELFLPYIGTVALDIDEIMDSTLHLQYVFDLLSGSCIAELKVSKVYNYQNANHTHKNVLYRYSGNILVNIPITGANYTQMFQAIIGAVATGIGGAAGAQSAKNAIASEAIEDKAALSQISSTTGMKAGIRRAGNLSSACGFMGAQSAELVLSLPKLAHLGTAQGKEFGFPRYAEYTLSDLRGFSRIIQVHLKSIKCTDAERGMIETALNGGVIVSGTATPTQSAATNTIKVYSYTCDKICLNKADGWNLIDTITGNWRDEKIDILAPVIKIEATNALTLAKILTEANYVYIADFTRYYYITGMSAGSGNCIILNLSIDAPMSWLAAIKTQKVVVDRQENEWNTYLSDGYIKTYNTPYTVVKKFPNGFTSENFILAVAGGGT